MSTCGLTDEESGAVCTLPPHRKDFRITLHEDRSNPSLVITWRSRNPPVPPSRSV